MNWVVLVQYLVQGQDFVSKVMNIQVPHKAGNFLFTSETNSFLSRIRLDGLSYETSCRNNTVVCEIRSSQRRLMSSGTSVRVKYLPVFRFFKTFVTDGKSTRPNAPEHLKLLPCVTLVMLNKCASILVSAISHNCAVSFGTQWCLC